MSNGKGVSDLKWGKRQKNYWDRDFGDGFFMTGCFART